MVTNFSLSTESKSIGLPYIDALDTELREFEVKHSSLGLPTYSAPSGGHDDIVMSILLAHSALDFASQGEYRIITL
jgi:hypothetical protein